MKIHKLCSVLVLSLSILASFTGCGSSEGSSVKGKDYKASLVDGVYYVRTANTNVCTPVYFGQGTFDEGSIKSTADSDRILWYKSDYDKIPTLYSGDSLIMYTTSSFDEKMTFERFEDLGYTIGLCGMTELKSGRFSISTDPDKKCTYPDGDTDEILKLTNKTVTLDTLGQQDVRAAETGDATSFLSDYGTILGLSQSGTAAYEATIYDGTVEHKYTFTANVRAFGSMSVTESYEYSFEEEKVINIKIPSDFKSGYYMINGVGLFRYVNGDSSTDISKMDFNEENSNEVTYSSKNSSSSSSASGYSTTTTTAAATATTAAEVKPDDITSKFTVTNPGQITIQVTFSDNGSTTTTPVTATLKTPSGKYVSMQFNASTQMAYRTIQAVKGEYTIIYYNLNGRTPKLTVISE